MAKRRTSEEQKTMYELWRSSGLTRMEFCRQNHISTRSMWLWTKRFGKGIAAKKNTPTILPAKDLKFYPVKQTNNSNNQEAFLEFSLPNGNNCKAYLSSSDLNTLLLGLLK
jgi:hypothetical protein